MTGIITAATLTAILVAVLVWQWNERRNAREIEHNMQTGNYF